MWITGGFIRDPNIIYGDHEAIKKTTATTLLYIGDFSARAGPALPQHLSSHCSTEIDRQRVFFYSNSNISAYGYIYNFENNIWTQASWLQPTSVRPSLSGQRKNYGLSGLTAKPK